MWFQKISISTLRIAIEFQWVGRVSKPNLYRKVESKTGISEGMGEGRLKPKNPPWGRGMHSFWKKLTQYVKSKRRSNEIMMSLN